MGHQRKLPLYTKKTSRGYLSHSPHRGLLERFADTEPLYAAFLVAFAAFFMVGELTPESWIGTTNGIGALTGAASFVAAAIMVGTAVAVAAGRMIDAREEHTVFVETELLECRGAGDALTRLLDARSQIVELAAAPAGAPITDEALVALEAVTFEAFVAFECARDARHEAKRALGDGAAATALRARCVADVAAQTALCARYATLVEDMRDSAAELYAAFAPLGTSDLVTLFEADQTTWDAVDAVVVHTERMSALTEAALELSPGFSATAELAERSATTEGTPQTG